MLMSQSAGEYSSVRLIGNLNKDYCIQMPRFTSFGSRLQFPAKSPTLDDDLLKVSFQKFTEFMCSSLCGSHTPIVKRQILSIYRTTGLVSFPFVLAASTSDVVPNFSHIYTINV
jgi:hypothetical protein